MNKQDTINALVKLWPECTPREKMDVLERIGIIPVVSFAAGATRLIQPEAARFFTPLVRELSFCLSKLDLAFTGVVRQRLDIGSPQLMPFLSESFYHRPRDEKGLPVGDEPGFAEKIVDEMRSYRNNLHEAIQNSPSQSVKQRQLRYAKKKALAEKATQKAQKKEKADNKKEK